MALWKIDIVGRVIASNTFRKAGVPSHCCFFTYPGRSMAAAVSAAAAGGAEDEEDEDGVDADAEEEAEGYTGMFSDSKLQDGQRGRGKGLSGHRGPSRLSLLRAELSQVGLESSLLNTIALPGPGCTSFLFSGDNGVVTLANDLTGATQDVVTELHSAVDTLEYDTSCGLLIVITRSLLMHRLLLDRKTGAVHALSRAKMPAVPGGLGVKSAGWAGGDLFLTSIAEEPILR